MKNKTIECVFTNTFKKREKEKKKKVFGKYSVILIIM